MFRTLVLAVAALVAALPIVGSAETIPAGINIHNGYIQANTHVFVHMPPQPESEHIKNRPGLELRLYSPFGWQENRGISSGWVHFLNDCCIAAGTRYELQMVAAGTSTNVVVHPILCNVRGTPFGFAVVTYTGDIRWDDRQGDWIATIKGRQDDARCPTA